MLQQKYNWIEKCWQVPPIRRISECCGLCCYVGQPNPWSPYSNADPHPTACAPRSRCCDPRSHPIFCCWSLIPYSLFFTTLCCHHFSSNVAVPRPCCLSEFTLTSSAPALTGPHFSVYDCKGNVGAFPRDKENWPYHSGVKLLHFVNQVRPICWKCWVHRIILRNFGGRILNSSMVRVRPISVENEALLKWILLVFKNRRERSWDSFSRAM